VYHISGQLDGTPKFDASLGGTITITQASSTNGTLGGSGSVTGSFLEGQIETVTDDAITATISSTGEIAFSLSDGTRTWSFTGRLSMSGATIQDGRHRLDLGDGGFVTGDWSGSRTT